MIESMIKFTQKYFISIKWYLMFYLLIRIYSLSQKFVFKVSLYRTAIICAEMYLCISPFYKAL